MSAEKCFLFLKKKIVCYAKKNHILQGGETPGNPSVFNPPWYVEQREREKEVGVFLPPKKDGEKIDRKAKIKQYCPSSWASMSS